MIAISDLLPDMISKYNALVLFRCDTKLVSCTASQYLLHRRRAIKIVQTVNPDSLAKFMKKMGK